MQKNAVVMMVECSGSDEASQKFRIEKETGERVYSSKLRLISGGAGSGAIVGGGSGERRETRCLIILGGCDGLRRSNVLVEQRHNAKHDHCNEHQNGKEKHLGSLQQQHIPMSLSPSHV